MVVLPGLATIDEGGGRPRLRRGDNELQCPHNWREGCAAAQAANAGRAGSSAGGSEEGAGEAGKFQPALGEQPAWA